MRRFTKFPEVVELLNQGWLIFTETGWAPYCPIFYILQCQDKENEPVRNIHRSTIEKLIREGVIGDRSSGCGKYRLLNREIP